jgi:hypothetical protein
MVNPSRRTQSTESRPLIGRGEIQWGPVVQRSLLGAALGRGRALITHATHASKMFATTALTSQLAAPAALKQSVRPPRFDRARGALADAAEEGDPRMVAAALVNGI